MKKIIGWIRAVEEWVYRMCDEHPAWNALTWLGHAAAVVFVAGAFGLAGGVLDVVANFFVALFGGEGTNIARDWAAFAGMSVASYYFWREAVDAFWRGRHIDAPKAWIWADHILDVLAPIVAVLWFT